MNQEQIRQVNARDEKWVTTNERVKISTTNVRLETTFWYTVKKVKDTKSYEFLLANKKCLVDVEVFQKILDICPRIQGVDFAELPNDETTLTFLLDLGYKDPLYNHTIMENVDYLESIWKTLHSRSTIGSSRKADVKTCLIPDDNIIPDPDFALELGKSISLTEAIEEEAARQVHVTHARIKVRRPAGDSQGSEQASEYYEEDDDHDKDDDHDEDDNDHDDYDNEDKSIDLEKTDDEETDDEFVHSGEYVQTDVEETDDEFVQGDEQVNDDKDEEMIIAEDAKIGNGDEEITDATNADAEKTEEVKDDTKKAEFPPSSSSLSVSSEFGDHFLKLSSDTSLISTIKDTTDAEINSLLDVKIQQEIPLIQSLSILNVPVSVISELSVLIPIHKTPSVAPATTLLPHPSVSTIPPILQQSTTLIPTPPITTKDSNIKTILDPLHAIIQRVFELEKYVQELKEVDNTTTLRATLKSEIPLAVHAFLGSSLGDELHKVLQRHTEEPIQKYPQQIDYKEMIENTVKNALEKTPLLAAQSSSQTQPSLKAVESLSEYELKIILFNKMDKSHSYLTRDKHQDLYDALFNSLSLDDAIASGHADIEKVLRKRDCDDKDPLLILISVESSDVSPALLPIIHPLLVLSTPIS
ncbi:hypothetical protein Tco_0298976 [Tanacetum coccineum]